MAETLTIAAAPEVGIHPDTAAAIYHAWPHASNSRLTALKRSPAHLRHQMTTPSEPTDAMRLGTAIHTAVLEPAEFVGRYVVAGTCSSVTGKGEPCRNSGILRSGGTWYCGVHGKGKPSDQLDVLSADEWARCEGVRAALLAHPAAAPLLALAGEIEVSLCWVDEESGVPCKARPDKLVGHAGVVLDLKTTADASPAAFTRSIFNFGYHRQAAFYLDGLAALGVPCTDFVFLAVEKEAPYGVGVYRLTDEAVEAGRQEIRVLLARYRECVETDHWPSYGDGILDIGLPAWAYGQLLTTED